MSTAAIIPAAGRGARMGADKALLRLGAQSAIERIVRTCRDAGVDDVIVVRVDGAVRLPELRATVVVVPPGGEMADSLRAAHATLSPGIAKIIVFPVDYPLVEADTVAAVLVALDRPHCQVALPQYRDRPGHPVAVRRAAFDGIAEPSATLRDLVRAAAGTRQTRAVPTGNPWVRTDLDRPEDYRAACLALTGGPWSTVEQMFRHRSRRAYRPDPLPDGQLERLVDAARHASTSSFIQAYSVIAVRETDRKAACARLCSGQAHISEAPVFLAICADLHKLALACEQNDTHVQSQSFELFLQATVDAALLGQNLQLAGEAEGLGSCMIGAARNHPVELAQLLELPPHVFVVFGLTMGVAADDPVPRGRMPLRGVLHDERYDRDAAAASLGGADDVMREWARRTNAAGIGYGGRAIDESKGWVDRMARAWGSGSSYAAARATLVAELRRLGFGLEGV